MGNVCETDKPFDSEAESPLDEASKELAISEIPVNMLERLSIQLSSIENSVLSLAP